MCVRSAVAQTLKGSRCGPQSPDGLQPMPLSLGYPATECCAQGHFHFLAESVSAHLSAGPCRRALRCTLAALRRFLTPGKVRMPLASSSSPASMQEAIRPGDGPEARSRMGGPVGELCAISAVRQRRLRLLHDRRGAAPHQRCGQTPGWRRAPRRWRLPKTGVPWRDAGTGSSSTPTTGERDVGIDGVRPATGSPPRQCGTTAADPRPGCRRRGRQTPAGRAALRDAQSVGSAATHGS